MSVFGFLRLLGSSDYFDLVLLTGVRIIALVLMIFLIAFAFIFLRSKK